MIKCRKVSSCREKLKQKLCTHAHLGRHRTLETCTKFLRRNRRADTAPKRNSVWVSFSLFLFFHRAAEKYRSNFGFEVEEHEKINYRFFSRCRNKKWEKEKALFTHSRKKMCYTCRSTTTTGKYFQWQNIGFCLQNILTENKSGIELNDSELCKWKMRFSE